jgi:hypothetical protein
MMTLLLTLRMQVLSRLEGLMSLNLSCLKSSRGAPLPRPRVFEWHQLHKTGHTSTTGQVGSSSSCSCHGGRAPSSLQIDSIAQPSSYAQEKIVDSCGFQRVAIALSKGAVVVQSTHSASGSQEMRDQR